MKQINLHILASACRNLRSLHLPPSTTRTTNQSLNTPAIEFLAHTCPHLESIELTGAVYILDPAIIALVNNCHKLAKINISRCSGLSVKSLRHLQECTKLWTVEFNHTFELSWDQPKMLQYLHSLIDTCPDLTSVRFTTRANLRATHRRVHHLSSSGNEREYPFAHVVREVKMSDRKFVGYSITDDMASFLRDEPILVVPASSALQPEPASTALPSPQLPSIPSSGSFSTQQSQKHFKGKHLKLPTNPSKSSKLVLTSCCGTTTASYHLVAHGRKKVLAIRKVKIVEEVKESKPAAEQSNTPKSGDAAAGTPKESKGRVQEKEQVDGNRKEQ
ncbi:hypothetical protein HDV00_006700 [Rhizophlyctis rosea]|nr:hypothetical protein HDV00_006700 [Rhizophlyctis rosea]